MNRIEVSGMSCAHCAAAVKQALEEIGLHNVNVSLEEGLATFNESGVDIGAVRAAIGNAGFEIRQ